MRKGGLCTRKPGQLISPPSCRPAPAPIGRPGGRRLPPCSAASRSCHQEPKADLLTSWHRPPIAAWTTAQGPAISACAGPTPPRSGARESRQSRQLRRDAGRPVRLRNSAGAHSFRAAVATPPASNRGTRHHRAPCTHCSGRRRRASANAKPHRRSWIAPCAWPCKIANTCSPRRATPCSPNAPARHGRQWHRQVGRGRSGCPTVPLPDRALARPLHPAGPAVTPARVGKPGPREKAPSRGPNSNGRSGPL
mmetsp:Transcript_54962/g.117971  ORF Transcript_54962/g.117971 Transcript_54962/m.117971 type:complete len:251 (+) Transcript_54962:264-1016(+)